MSSVNSIQKKMTNKLYQITEYKMYERCHYVWAPDEKAAKELAAKYSDVMDSHDYELDTDNWCVAESDYPGLIEKQFTEFILNPEDKDD